MFAVNGKRVDSGAIILAGETLECSSVGAVSYRWTNVRNDSGAAVSYGNELVVSQHGAFSYICTAFVDCTSGSVCSLSKNIVGLARGRPINYYYYYYIIRTLGTTTDKIDRRTNRHTENKHKTTHYR